MSEIIEISAVTLRTTDMATAIAFYEKLGFVRHRGGENASFATFRVGRQRINLRLRESRERQSNDSLVIINVQNVDRFHQRLIESGLKAEFHPRDAAWGERYFHIRDPDGNQLSFAQEIN